MATTNQPLTKGIRRVSLWYIWFVALFAPLKFVYDLLAKIGVHTRAPLWEILVNLCFFIAVLAWGWFLLLVATGSVAFCLSVPIAFLVEEDKQEIYVGRIVNAVHIVTAVAVVVVGILNLRYVANGTFQNVGSMDFFDWMIAAVGAIILASVYVYLYLAATGQLTAEEEPEDKPEHQVRKYFGKS